MDNYIQGLIARMSDDSYRPGEKRDDQFMYESQKTISWAAYEEARLLNNPAFFDELYAIIDSTDSTDVKRYAYFILGYNAKNAKDLNATAFLLKKLPKEEKRDILVVILDLLAELYKPRELDISYIYKLASHRNWHIRSSAFRALTNSEERVEDFLIDKLITTDKKDDIRPLLTSLMYVGTAKSIPYVEKHLKSRPPFVKSYSHNVLAVIMLREKFPFEEIQKKLKVSRDFVQTQFERLDILTRTG
ncbi:MAG TPA: hypothetical protein VHD83_23885 [Puia sp.]|nr:hypothetical protein [Puia sp.]